MTKRIKDGGFAFPFRGTVSVGNGGELAQALAPSGGMSLRDYFAAKAMAALLSNNAWRQGYCEEAPEDDGGLFFLEGTATEAYNMADAMLKAREVSQ